MYWLNLKKSIIMYTLKKYKQINYDGKTRIQYLTKEK